MVVVRFKQLPHAKGIELPSYAMNGDAGFDLSAGISDSDVPFDLVPGEIRIVPTGLILAIPKGFEGQLRPRSGLAAKHGITVLNAPGTIDSSYRGEIKVILINHGSEPYCIYRGDRIAQLVIAPVHTVTLQLAVDLDNTERGEGGFGSTG